MDTRVQIILPKQVDTNFLPLVGQTLKRDSSKNSEDDETQCDFQTDTFHCIKLVANILYFILLSPFKIVVQKTNTGLTVKFVSSWWRKILWGILQGISLFYSFSFLKLAGLPTKSIREDPSQLYRLFGISAWCVGATLWPILVLSKRSQGQVASIFLQSYTLTSDPQASPQTFESLYIKLILGATIAFNLALNSSTVAVYLNGLGLQIQTLGLQVPLPESQICQVILVSLVTLFNSHLSILNWTIFLAPLSASLIIHKVSKDFQSYRTNLCESQGGFKKILKAYDTIKQFVGSVNSFTSPINLLLIVELAALYSTTFTFLLGDNKLTADLGNEVAWAQRISICFFLCVLGSVILIGADAHATFKNTSDWIFQTCLDKAKVDPDVYLKAILWQNEMTTNPLGVRAHHFIVSYSILATILSTIFTYIFILLQFNSTL